MAPGYREPHGALARKGVVMTVTAGRRPSARAPRPGPGRRCHDASRIPIFTTDRPVSPVAVGEGEPGGCGVLVAADPGGKEVQFRLVVGASQASSSWAPVRSVIILAKLVTWSARWSRRGALGPQAGESLLMVDVQSVGMVH